MGLAGEQIYDIRDEVSILPPLAISLLLAGVGLFACFLAVRNARGPKRDRNLRAVLGGVVIGTALLVTSLGKGVEAFSIAAEQHALGHGGYSIVEGCVGRFGEQRISNAGHPYYEYTVTLSDKRASAGPDPWSISYEAQTQRGVIVGPGSSVRIYTDPDNRMLRIERLPGPCRQTLVP